MPGHVTFDAHAYRTEDYDGVKDFARGCMRTYLILKEKAARWNDNKEIKEILREFTEIRRHAGARRVFEEKCDSAAGPRLRQRYHS